MMHHIWIPRAGDTTVLELREAPVPEPASGHVLIKVGASGINFADIMTRKGLYQDAPDFPAVPGLEVAGEVAAVGPGVTGIAPGDHVMAPTRFGGYSSHVSVRQSFVIKRPEGMPVLAGGAFLVTYLTAYQALVIMGGIRKPEELGRPARVLVVNASGGVGTAAADLGKIFGARLYGAASPGKHPFILERGYDAAIDYRTKGWEQTALEMTDGKGFDIILDPVGGANWGAQLRYVVAHGPVGDVWDFDRGFLVAQKQQAGVVENTVRHSVAQVFTAFIDQQEPGCSRREPRPHVGSVR